MDANKTPIFCEHVYPVVERCESGSKRQAVVEDEQCYQADIGLTTFLSTRSFLAANPWSEELKTAEHESWFWGLKQRTPPAKIVGCLDISMVHNYGGYSKIWEYGYWKSYRSLRSRRHGLVPRWTFVKENEEKCCMLAEKNRKMS